MVRNSFRSYLHYGRILDDEMKTLALATFLAVLEICSGARILGVFLYPGRSHFLVFQPLLETLARRGHEVVILSHFPRQEPLANYKDITFEGTIPLKLNTLSIRHMTSLPDHRVFIDRIWGEAVKGCNILLQHPNIQRLIHSKDEKFDLLITEVFGSNCYLGFAYKFKAPIVTMTSTLPFPWNTDPIGNPDHPCLVPSDMIPMSERMTFLDRLANTVYWVLLRVGFRHYSDIPSDTIARNYFGKEMPPLWELASNVCLLLTNTHSITHQPRAMVSAVVEVGGIHIPEAKALPQDLKNFLDEAKDGVIYFSMGSMIRADTLHDDKRQALIDAFSELPQRVLWKWEGDFPQNLPQNVRISKWLPQFDILNHPNVRVFLGHGGLLGTMEAVQCGVPIVGIPIYGDQEMNLMAVVAKGMAIMLNYNLVTKETLLDSLRDVLNNASYQNNAKRLSQIFLTRRLSPLETAVYWTELVLQSKGALPMRSDVVGMPWYQYLLLDVFGFFFTIVVGILFFFYKLTVSLFLLYRQLHRSQTRLRESKSKKRK